MLPEIYLHILSFLDYKDINRYRLVCKAYRDITKELTQLSSLDKTLHISNIAVGEDDHEEKMVLEDLENHEEKMTLEDLDKNYLSDVFPKVKILNNIILLINYPKYGDKLRGHFTNFTVEIKAMSIIGSPQGYDDIQSATKSLPGKSHLGLYYCSMLDEYVKNNEKLLGKDYDITIRRYSSFPKKEDQILVNIKGDTLTSPLCFYDYEWTSPLIISNVKKVISVKPDIRHANIYENWDWQCLVLNRYECMSAFFKTLVNVKEFIVCLDTSYLTQSLNKIEISPEFRRPFDNGEVVMYVESVGEESTQQVNNVKVIFRKPKTYEYPEIMPVGATGSTGAIGPQGAIGLQGAIGPQGAMGLMGPVGIGGLAGNGMIGLQGATGATGVRGYTGATGMTGAIGPMGMTGPPAHYNPASPSGNATSNGNSNPTTPSSNPGASKKSS